VKRALLILCLLFAGHPTALAFDPDDPPDTLIPLTRHLTFGATLQYEQMRVNGVREDDPVQSALSLAFSFDPPARFRAFLETEISWEWEREDTDRTHLEIQEAFLLFKAHPDGRLLFQMGRQRFSDARQWLYDETLDALRLIYLRPTGALDLSASRSDRPDLLNDDPVDRVRYYAAAVNAALGDRDEDGDANVEIAGHILARHDASDARMLFLGLHAGGESFEDTESWLSVAHVRGREASRRVRATGFDVGATHTPDWPLSPSFSVGVAFGPGDDSPEDGVDEGFRQTGLHNNEGEFNGVQSFKYYGELFDPELSNLAIVTYGVGLRPTAHSSVDLVYHRYRQHRAADEQSDVGVDADPDGQSRDLGSEVDLIVGFAGDRHVEWKAVLGYFIPGAAFPDLSHGVLVSLEVQYQF
jgi:hypothetical protein